MMAAARLRALLTICATLAVIAVAAPPAQAATTVLACDMAATATFDPGVPLLVSTRQDVGGSVTLGTQVSPLTPCTSPTGQPFVGGAGDIDGTGTLNCLPNPLGLVGTASGTIGITWYDGSAQVAGQSTIAWSLTISGPLVVFDASVVSGDMNGSTVQMPQVVTGFNGLCGIGAPVVAASFAGAATVVQL